MSSSFSETNQHLFDLHHPLAAKAIPPVMDARYLLEPSLEQGFPNLVYRGSTPSVAFYDPAYPTTHVRSGLTSFEKHQASLVVMMGAGLGYHALELVKRTSLVRLIIIEQDPAVLRALIHAVDFSSVLADSRVRIIAGLPEEELYTALRSAIGPHFAGLKSMAFLPLAASIRTSGPYYEKCYTTIQEIAQIYISEHGGNDPYDSLAGYEHFLANIETCLTRPGGRHLKGFFRKRPAIVVATGPSLQKSIPMLREVEERAVIISADASLRILHAHGIHPHLVATTERTPGFDKQFINLENLDRTVLAAVSFTHPTTLRAYNGPIVFFQRWYAFTSALGFAEDAIEMGLSTANMAYDVARHMGCDPVILVGNDLAFDDAGNTHSAGFLYGQKQPVYEDFDRFQVPGNYAPMVTTCQVWFDCIKQYEKRIADWDGALINATAGGARIAGSLVMPLSEALETYCSSPFQPREAILQSILTWQPPSGRVTPIGKAVAEYITLLDRFIDMCKRMREALKGTLNDMPDGVSSKGISSSVARRLQGSIPVVNEALNALLQSPLYAVFREFYVPEVLPVLLEWQVINHRFTSPVWENAYRIKLAHDFFGSLGQLSISLRNVLLGAQKTIAAVNPDL